MHVWILNHHAKTPDMSGGSRHYSIGRELVRSGHDVTIIASSFGHAEKREMRLEQGEGHRLEMIDGVRFCWLHTTRYTRNDWRRILGMLSYGWRAYWLGRRLTRMGHGVPRPDVIIGSSVHLLAVVAAYYLSRFYRCHFVMEVRDLWPQTLVDMGALGERHLLTRLLRMLERFLYRRAERIIVLLPRAREYIAELGIDASKVQWIPNGVNLSRFPVQKSRSLADRQFTVMYVGAHGYANNLDVILDAAREVQRRGHASIHFVFVGDGPEKPGLVAKKEQWRLSNVKFYDPVPKMKLPQVLAEADAFVLVLRDLPLYKYGISLNKLYDYLAATRPIELLCQSAIQRG